MRYNSWKWILLALTTSVAACQNLNGIKSGRSQMHLDRKSAESRAARISDVSYELSLELPAEGPEFKGQQKVQFELSDSTRDLFLDFHGQVRSLSINGHPSPHVEHYGLVLALPKEHLVLGTNTVEISFLANYRTDGVGLHRFQDPSDNEVYLHTQFQPFDANKVAPFFDQPDLKAVLKLRVLAPKKWTVVTATFEESSKVVGDMKQWDFKPTPRISTYLYSLHAGPYKMWKSSYGRVPLRIFARKSMAPYVRTLEWFRVTRQGFEFFEKFFDHPYPFEKYDQLIAPEFNFGAMENVGAVTFSEKYLRRGSITVAERQNLANTILHELAHMWFGNLVTMKWWNDLWLNESFATYLATLALHENTDFRKDAWTEFFQIKMWAYREDQWVTTHPIEAPVQNTNEAFANFDGITYGKGAAIIKQLAFHLSAEKFKNGIQDYIKKHAWKNTELTDFVQALEGHSTESLQDWKSAWLQSTGVEKLTVNFSCDDQGRIQKVAVTEVQGRPLRPQSFRLGFLFQEKNQLVEKASRRLRTSGAGLSLSAEEFEGMKCPDLIFLNSGDHAYALQTFDSEQAQMLLSKASRIKDTQLRFEAWHSLWQMLLDGQLSPTNFTEAVMTGLESEQVPRIVQFLTRSLTGSSQRLGAVDYMSTDEDSQALRQRLEVFVWNQFLKLKDQPDLQALLFDTVLKVASKNELRTRLRNYYLGKNRVPGFNLDQDRRWSLLANLCRLGEADCETWVENELKKDSSDRGKKAQLTARAAQPVWDVKLKYFTMITDKNTPLSLTDMNAIFSSLFPPEQNHLKSQLSDPIYAFVKTELDQRPETFQESFSEAMSPLFCEETAQRTFARFVKSQKINPISKKSFKINLQEDERCIRLRRPTAPPS